MAGQGTKILASDFNQIQTIISNVLGTGSGQLGYGQTVTSSQVTIGSKITASGWVALRNDLLKARQHQTGIDESGNLTLVNTSTIVTEANRAAYLAYANTVQSNSLTIASSGQSSTQVLSNPSKTTPWTNTITHTVNLNFGTSDKARYYFNSGSSIQFYASLNNTSTQLNTDWNHLLGAMGIISMNYNSTSQVPNSASYPSAGSSPTGTSASSIGYYQLTTTPQLIFTKTASTYSGDQYQIFASVNAGRTVLTFSIRFEAPSYGPGGGTHESVTGTLTSVVQANYASGSNVSMTTPVNYLPSVTQSGP